MEKRARQGWRKGSAPDFSTTLQHTKSSCVNDGGTKGHSSSTHDAPGVTTNIRVIRGKFLLRGIDTRLLFRHKRVRDQGQAWIQRASQRCPRQKKMPPSCLRCNCAHDRARFMKSSNMNNSGAKDGVISSPTVSFLLRNSHRASHTARQNHTPTVTSHSLEEG